MTDTQINLDRIDYLEGLGLDAIHAGDMGAFMPVMWSLGHMTDPESQGGLTIEAAQYAMTRLSEHSVNAEWQEEDYDTSGGEYGMPF